LLDGRVAPAEAGARDDELTAELLAHSANRAIDICLPGSVGEFREQQGREFGEIVDLGRNICGKLTLPPLQARTWKSKLAIQIQAIVTLAQREFSDTNP